MKRKIIPLLIAFALLLSCFSFSYADQDGIGVYIDGAKLETAAEPINYYGNVMVPMRDIFEALGATVSIKEWNNTSKTIIATKENMEIQVIINAVSMAKSYKEFPMSGGYVLDAPAIISNGKTMVPIRAIAEAFGAKVEWSGAEKRIDITSRPYEYYMEFPCVPDMGKMFNAKAGKDFNVEDNLNNKDSKSMVVYQYSLKDLPADYLEKYCATLDEKGFTKVKNAVQSGVVTDFYVDPNEWFLLAISRNDEKVMVVMQSNVNLTSYDKTTGEYLSIFNTNFVPSYAHISNQMAFSIKEDDKNTRTYFYIFDGESASEYIQKLLDEGFALSDPTGAIYTKNNISVNVDHLNNFEGLYIQIKKITPTN